jgi:large subunit ribosomal protein L32
MALPKRKISKGRKGRRRANKNAQKPQLVKDPKTGDLVPPHEVNKKTGKYKGKKIQKPQ